MQSTSEGRQTVGISGIGYYIPKDFISSEEIARIAEIPVEVLTEKVGMSRKPVAHPAEQPSAMALCAAREALRKAHLEPPDIDLVIFCGSAPQDYLLWSASGKLQHSLGAVNAFAFELTNGCNGLNIGMKVGNDMLLGSPRLRHALIASADKYSPFIDFSNPDDISTFHVADAAAAVVLSRDEPTNRILSYYQITDGSLSDYVKIKSGGTMYPCSLSEKHDRQTFSVDDPKELGRIFADVYVKNYLKAIHGALEQSGHTADEIDFLFTNQVKASTMAEILQSLNIPPSRTFSSIETHGHMGTVDIPFALASSLEAKKIPAGSLVVLASSAVGFSWAAMVIRF